MTLHRRTFLSLTAGLVLAAPALAQAPAIPIEIINGKIFVPIAINGRPVLALLDSGSALYGLDAGAAARLGVEAKGGRAAVRGVQRTLRGRFAKVDRLTIGTVELSNTQMLVLDYASLVSTVGRPIEAALGGDFFKRFVVEIDVAAKTLRLHDRSGFAAPPAPAVLAPLKSIAGLMAAIIVFPGRGEVAAVVDTGSDSPLIVTPIAAERLSLLRGRRVSEAPLGGVDGPSLARIATAPPLTLGGRTFEDAPVQIPRRSLGVEANLGMGLLSHFHLWLDFGGRRMWLAPIAKAPVFRRDLLGFYGQVEGDVIRIGFVAKGSPAAAAGFRAGEVVVEINGEIASRANLALKDAAEGTALSFTLAGGQTRRLTLARYY